MDRHPTDAFLQQYMADKMCFGCGHNNAYGLQIKSYWQDDNCICIWQPEPKHQGWPDITCGGIIATLIDCHCISSAMATAVHNENRLPDSKPYYRFATGTLNIKFLSPTPITTPMTLKAKVTNIKEDRIYTLHCNVFTNNEQTVAAEVIAFLLPHD